MIFLEFRGFSWTHPQLSLIRWVSWHPTGPIFWAPWFSVKLSRLPRCGWAKQSASTQSWCFFGVSMVIKMCFLIIKDIFGCHKNEWWLRIVDGVVDGVGFLAVLIGDDCNSWTGNLVLNQSVFVRRQRCIEHCSTGEKWGYPEKSPGSASFSPFKWPFYLGRYKNTIFSTH